MLWTLLILIPVAQGNPGEPSLEGLLRVSKEKAAARRVAMAEKIRTIIEGMDLPFATNKSYIRPKLKQLVDLGGTSLPYLLEALDNAGTDDRMVQRGKNCARALVSIGLAEETAPHCRKLLESGSAEGKKNSLYVLGKLKAEESLKNILPFLDPEVESSLRWEAIRSLGWMASEKAVAPLVQLLKKSDRKTADIILVSLDQIGSPKAVPGVGALLGEPYFRDSLSKLITFLRRREDRAAIPFLTQSLALKDLSSSLKVELFQAIAQLGAPSSKEGVAALKPFLEEELDEVRQEAAFALNDLGDTSGVKGLLQPFNSYIKERPKESPGYEARGKVNIRLRRYREALRDFKDAIRYTPKKANPAQETFINQARAYCGLKQWKDAYNVLRSLGMGKRYFARYLKYPEFQALSEHPKYGKIFGE